mmetsp:Transcript_1289/g.1533  ORF Transcript_1289/g.1533 Transcript_1289/m.1533 type:complete len:533 (-) Transcript_1289:1529-3127(-)
MAEEEGFLNRFRGIFNDLRRGVQNLQNRNGRERVQDERNEENNVLQELIQHQQQLENMEPSNPANPLEPIFITDLLKAYPVEKSNSNKIVLPHSLLEEIHKKKVWDNRPPGKPLIFELSVADPVTTDVIAETHVGVDDFTAPAGKIGLPYKTALSLTKERGIGWLKENPLVFLRYVEIETTPETTMSIQPRGKGFHNDDESVVQLDIKSLLERTLKNHFVLTKEDWIPLFHEGRKYELIVQDLKPNDVIDVLNTDLTVDILPSEETSEEIEAREKASEEYKAFMSKRKSRNDEKLSKLSSNPEPAKEKKDSYVNVRVKLPKGGSPRRRFDISNQYGLILDWVETEMFKSEYLPKVLPPPELEYWFKLAVALPGKKKTSFANEDSWKTLKQILEEKSLKQGGGLSFIVEMVKFQSAGGDEGGANGSDDPLIINNEWLRMAARLEQNIEKELADEEREANDRLSDEEVAEMATKIEGYGIDIGIAKEVAKLYGRQVRELELMGFNGDKIAIAIPLLKDRAGNLSAVVEMLAQYK